MAIIAGIAIALLMGIGGGILFLKWMEEPKYDEWDRLTGRQYVRFAWLNIVRRDIPNIRQYVLHNNNW